MRELNKTMADEPEPALETGSGTDMPRLLAVFKVAAAKLRMFNTPLAEIRELNEALSEALENNRMDTDEAFRKFVTEELASTVMQKLAKTISIDKNVSFDQSAV